MPPRRSSATLTAGLSVAAASAAVLLIYALRLDGAAGLMVDDAWYVLLAKALAEGSGYRLISSPAGAIIPNYPPGFPAVLAPVFWLVPEFPSNIWLLKSISILAMGGVGGLTYLYLHRCRGLARDLSACAAIAVAITPAFVFLATSTVMSECVFTFAQLVTVVLIHFSVDSAESPQAMRLTVLAGLCAAASVFIRSAAAGLVLAVILLLVKDRLWRRAVWFGGIVAICVLPWAVHVRTHAASDQERAAHGGAVVYNYTDQFWMRWAGTPEMGRATVFDLPARAATNLVDIFARDVAGILLPTVLRGSAESGQEVVALGGKAGLSSGSMGSAAATMIISLALSAIVLLGFIRAVQERATVAEILLPLALATVAVWPFWSFRFVLPLTPFLFFYFVRGIQAISPSAARVALLCIVGLDLFDHAGYILLPRPPGVDWVSQAREVDAAVDWIGSSLDRHEGLAASNPALIYLRTGRKSVTFDHFSGDWAPWKSRGIHYIACLVPLELPSGPSGSYKVLYRTSGRLWVIAID
jgi:hypothetical protein